MNYGEKGKGIIMANMINHPAHYQLGNGMETIDIIEAATCDLYGIEAFNTGNAIKYLCRWKKKNGIQDLEKAVWYIQALIAHEQQEMKKQVDMVNAQFNGGVMNG